MKKSVMVTLASVCVFTLVSTSASFAQNKPVQVMNEERIAQLKVEMRKIANENIGNRENLADIRAQLEPLATELATFYKSPGLDAELPLLAGAWKETFSDDVEPEPPGFATERDQTFQVVTDKGYFYNLANLKGFVTVLGVLRGKYEKAENNFLNIEFTKVSVRPTGLGAEENLIELTEKIENGAVFTIVPPGGNKAPNGPVGAKGNIKNLYLDADFRVATGSNFADGKMDLFVLDRVTMPVKYK